MSTKIPNYPGLHKVEANQPELVNLATKVTGRNLAAVSYIISQEAEKRGVPLALAVVFSEDGSLFGGSVVEQGSDNADFDPGDYLVLEALEDEANFMTADEYRQEYREVTR